MKDIVNNLKKSDSWKIKLTVAINFIYSKDTDEEHIMYSKSDKIEIMIYFKADEVVKELFESLLKRYQIGLQTSMKSSDFIFEFIYLLYYKCHIINLDHGGSYIDSPDWIKNKKTTIYLVNDDDKCFQYTASFALNQEEIGKNLQIIYKFKPFINTVNITEKE